MSKVPFVLTFAPDKTPASLTVFLEGVTYPVLASARFFNEIFDALKNNDAAKIKHYLRMKNSIAEFSGGKFQLFADSLYFNGEEIRNCMVERILALHNAGLDASPVVNFLENLLQNPSRSAIDELYLFLEHNDLPITEDGHFLAYKMIRDDYKDKYTSSMDNSVGATVKMERQFVNANREETCSHGLHFCSLEYVEKGNYGNGITGNGRLVVLKINPRDVVSIPSDYNNSKGRACEYLVQEEIAWTDRLKSYFTALSENVITDNDDVDPDDFDDEVGEDEGDDEENDAVDLDEIVDSIDVTNGKLTSDEVAEIRKLLDVGGFTLTDIGKMFGVHRTTVQRIRDGVSHTNS